MKSFIQRFKEGWAHAFKVEDEFIPTPEDQELLTKVASFLCKRKMQTPALMILEVGRPLNFVASQLIHFLQPTIALFLNTEEISRFGRLLEHRSSVDLFIDCIMKEEERPTAVADDTQVLSHD